MELNIKDKVALVTGGAQGIGSSISKNLLQEGSKVIITSRNLDAINDFKKENSDYVNNLYCVNTELLDDKSISFVNDEKR